MGTTSDFKLTYSTMFDPPEGLHLRFEQSLASDCARQRADGLGVLCPAIHARAVADGSRLGQDGGFPA